MIDGNSATKLIRQLENGSDIYIPILGVIANVRPVQQSEMLKAGVDDIIHKPFRTEELIVKISQFMASTVEVTHKKHSDRLITLDRE